MQNLLAYNSIFGNLLGHGLFTNISVTMVVLNPETTVGLHFRIQHNPADLGSPKL